MHVLIIPSWYPTKESPVRGSYFYEQTYALQKTNCKVGVICADILSLRHLFRKEYSLNQSIRFNVDNGVPTYQHVQWNYFPFHHHFMASRLIKNALAMFSKYVTDYGIPDVIHAHSVMPAGLIASEIKKKYNIPFVITEHSSAFGRDVMPKWLYSVVKECFTLASERIVVSPKLGEVLNSLLGDCFQSWRWVPNMTSLAGDNLCFQRPNNNNNHFQFLNVAMMTPNKGQSDLLEAFAQSFKQEGDVYLRIAGDGRIRHDLERLAHRLGISEQVSFLGTLSRDAIRDEMQRCNAFVMSSHYETFGVVLIEALSFGKPVVATQCGGADCIVNKDNGLLVPPKKPEELSEAMKKIRVSYNDYDSYSISEKCSLEFGGKAITDRLLHIYEQVHKTSGVGKNE